MSHSRVEIATIGRSEFDVRCSELDILLAPGSSAFLPGQDV